MVKVNYILPYKPSKLDRLLCIIYLPIAQSDVIRIPLWISRGLNPSSGLIQNLTAMDL